MVGYTSRKAIKGECYCEFCGYPFPEEELFYVSPMDLSCSNCYEGALQELGVVDYPEQFGDRPGERADIVAPTQRILFLYQLWYP